MSDGPLKVADPQGEEDPVPDDGNELLLALGNVVDSAEQAGMPADEILSAIAALLVMRAEEYGADLDAIVEMVAENTEQIDAVAHMAYWNPHRGDT